MCYDLYEDKYIVRTKYVKGVVGNKHHLKLINWPVDRFLVTLT